MCKTPGTEKTTNKKGSVIKITPNVSIGPLSLGPVPKEMKPLVSDIGFIEYENGLKAEVLNDIIVDIWIVDLKKLDKPVKFSGKTIPTTTSLKDVLSLLGPCEQIERKGMVRYNCTNGFSIGTDYRGRGEYIQIRVIHR